jgi:hypothetical protein
MEPTALVLSQVRRGSSRTLIWLDSVKRADRSLLTVVSPLSQHALSVLFVLQIRLVGGTAF